MLDAAPPVKYPTADPQGSVEKRLCRLLRGSTAPNTVGVAESTLSLGFCKGEAMFVINKPHKLFRKSTIESVKLSDV